MNIETPTQPTIETTKNPAKLSWREKLGMTLAALVVGTGLAGAHSVGANERSEPDKSFSELVKDAAKNPPTPGQETPVEDLRLHPNDPDRNFASEAVLNSQKTQQYMDKHPEQVSTIIDSANSLPTPGSKTEEYVIKLEDVDKDGDKEAIAAEKE